MFSKSQVNSQDGYIYVCRQWKVYKGKTKNNYVFFQNDYYSHTTGISN